MAADHRQSEADLLQQLATRMRESLLPVDRPFDEGEIEAAASLVLQTAEQRRPGEPAIAITSVESGTRSKLRLALVNDDMPFLVDSISAQVAEFGLSIDRLVHPVLRVERDAQGKLEDLPGKGGNAPRESMIFLECDMRCGHRTARSIGVRRRQVFHV